VVKNRKWMFKSFPTCFIASEGVTWLCKKYGVTKPGAVRIGRAMEKHGYIEHVMKLASFNDIYAFFRFMDVNNNDNNNNNGDSSNDNKPRNKKNVQNDLGIKKKRSKDLFQSFRRSSSRSSSIQLETAEIQTCLTVAKEMSHPYMGVKVKDRKWLLKEYKNCFVAHEAVNWVQLNIGVRADAALALCQKMQRLNYIQHVSGNSVPFINARLFFRFSDAVLSNSNSSSTSDSGLAASARSSDDSYNSYNSASSDSPGEYLEQHNSFPAPPSVFFGVPLDETYSAMNIPDDEVTHFFSFLSFFF